MDNPDDNNVLFHYGKGKTLRHHLGTRGKVRTSSQTIKITMSVKIHHTEWLRIEIFIGIIRQLK